jgi:hypothetical protein
MRPPDEPRTGGDHRARVDLAGGMRCASAVAGVSQRQRLRRDLGLLARDDVSNEAPVGQQAARHDTDPDGSLVRIALTKEQ